MFGLDLYVIGGAIIAALVAFGGLLWKTKKAGRNEVIAEQARKNDATRKEFDKIDSAAPDLDTSLDRLHNRAKRQRKPAPK